MKIKRMDSLNNHFKYILKYNNINNYELFFTNYN